MNNVILWGKVCVGIIWLTLATDNAVQNSPYIIPRQGYDTGYGSWDYYTLMCQPNQQLILEAIIN